MSKIRVFKFTYGDGTSFYNSNFKYEEGKEVCHEGPVVMCSSGLHFSRTESNAMGYADYTRDKGLLFWEFEIDEGDIHSEQDNKLVLKSGATATPIRFEDRHIKEGEGEVEGGLWLVSNATVKAWDNATVKAWDNATVVVWNKQSHQIIENSRAFIVDRSGGHPVGYDAAAWNEKQKKDKEGREGSCA
jgi:hypothetical protein